jgi:Holliday junction resolvase-like predicted endonuclease
MQQVMKKLPIGIQSFEKLRTNNFLYVDKTKEIHRLITEGNVYFLSRPRRFGKSLLVNIFEAIFKGKKELFEGLYIQDKIDWTQQYPVIKIDWSCIKHGSAEEMERSMSDFLNEIAHKYQITLAKGYASDCFDELIRQLHQKTDRQVVILVDEYDMPIPDTLDKTERIDEIRKFLQSFYKILKAADEHLRFVFLTGVSKFAGVSVFSGLNNLNDITLDEKYASICGYTQPELESYFSEYIEETALYAQMSKTKLLDKIRFWYDGYSWDGKTPVYNPFSTLLFFDKRQFDNYWFRTGTPTFLIEILKRRNQLQPILEPITVESIVFESFDPQRIDEVPLLFQTGYLTIKHKKFVELEPEYTIGLPNNEVKQSLLTCLMNAYTDYPVYKTDGLKQRMQQQLFNNDAGGLEQSLREMLAYIPYPLHIGREAYYHSLLLLWLKLLGFDIIGEMMTNAGRIDAVWKFSGHTIIVEVKYQPKKAKIENLLNEALKQIKANRYAERFNDGQRISLLGVAFAGNEIGCKFA